MAEVRLPNPGETPFWVKELAPISKELVRGGWTWTSGGCWAFAYALKAAIGGTLCGICEKDSDGGWGTNHAMVYKNGRYYDYSGVVDPQKACEEMARERGKPQRLMSSRNSGFEAYEDDFLDDDQWQFLHRVLGQLRGRSRADITEADEDIRGGYDGEYDDPEYYDSIRKRGAAGVFFIARSTGRVLLGLRSDVVDMPRHWGGFGGAIDEGETPEDAVRREIVEELGYRGSYLLKRAFLYSSPTFQYQNFVAFVDEEFNANLNWENVDEGWFDLDRLPSPLHPGLKMCLADALTQRVIRDGLGLNESTAAGRHYAANPVDPEIDDPSEIKGTKLHYSAETDLERAQRRGFDDRLYDLHHKLRDAKDKAREPIVKKINRLRQHRDNYGQRLAAKRAARVGMNVHDFAVVHAALTRYTQKSYQKLDPRVLALARKMTVIPSLLPRYVYRGIYIDGVKIKDRKKFIEEWAVGQYPRVKPGKPTSWTASEGVAYSFMQSQDSVKDNKNGFHVLLRYDLSKDKGVVVADLRNLPGNRFWNQQELILSKDAVDYEVAAIFATSEELDDFREKSGKNVWASGSGSDENRTMLHDMFRISPGIPTSARARWSQRYLGMTVAQYEKATHARLVAEDSLRRDLQLPLYWFDQRTLTWTNIDEVRSPTEFHCTFDPDVVGRFRGDNTAPLGVTMTVRLVQASPKKFLFEIIFDPRQDKEKVEQAKARILSYIGKQDVLLHVTFSVGKLRR